MKKKQTYPHKGLFRPLNPSKYQGDPTNIVYRSSLEWKTMREFDRNPNVLMWASEERYIPYRSPLDGRVHRYFIDFIIKIRNKEGLVETLMVEVKPASQCVPPVKRKSGRITKAYINEVQRWGVNEAKFKAAREYAAQRGWRFELLTETMITGDGPRKDNA
jgi:hypothetical protein